MKNGVTFALLAVQVWVCLGWTIERKANERSALDVRTVLCFHSERHWPGVSELRRSPTMRPERKEKP